VPVWGDNATQYEAGQLLSVYAPDFALAGRDSEAQAAYLLELAERYRLDQWVLFSNQRRIGPLCSRNFHAALSRRFRVSTPTWDVLRWAYDKRLTYRLAAEERVDFPSTIYPLPKPISRPPLFLFPPF